MYSHLCARLYIHSGEGLAVKFIHPLRHVSHATGQNLAHGLVAADTCRSHRSVRPHVRRPTVARINTRRGTRDSGGDESLRLTVLPSLNAPHPRPHRKTEGNNETTHHHLMVAA